MKIPKGKKIIIGNREFTGEVPDELLSDKQKTAYEKKFGILKPKTEKKK